MDGRWKEEEYERGGEITRELRRLAMIDEGFVEDRAGLVLGLAEGISPGSQNHGATAGGGFVGLGSTAVCLEWGHEPGAGGRRE